MQTISLFEILLVFQDRLDLEKQLMDSERANRGTLNKLKLANEQLKDAEDDLATERSKLIDMSQNVEMCEMLQRKVQEMSDKVMCYMKIYYVFNLNH